MIKHELTGAVVILALIAVPLLAKKPETHYVERIVEHVQVVEKSVYPDIPPLSIRSLQRSLTPVKLHRVKYTPPPKVIHAQ